MLILQNTDLATLLLHLKNAWGNYFQFFNMNFHIGKDPDAGKDWSQEESGWQRMRWLDGSSGSWWWAGKPGMLQSMGSYSQTWLSNWTELNMNYHWKKSYDQPRQHIKKQRYHFSDRGPYNQSCGFSSSHVWMWELDRKEGWAPKNGCFWTEVLEKTLESPLDCKEIKPMSPKGN